MNFLNLVETQNFKTTFQQSQHIESSNPLQMLIISTQYNAVIIDKMNNLEDLWKDYYTRMQQVYYGRTGDEW